MNALPDIEVRGAGPVLSPSFCGVPLKSTTEAMSMAAAYFAYVYSFYLRQKRRGEFVKVPCEGTNLLALERQTVARAVRYVMTAALSSGGTHNSRKSYALRNLLCRARHVRSDVGLRQRGLILRCTDAGDAVWAVWPVREGGVR